LAFAAAAAVVCEQARVQVEHPPATFLTSNSRFAALTYPELKARKSNAESAQNKVRKAKSLEDVSVVSKCGALFHKIWLSDEAWKQGELVNVSNVLVPHV
jgi:hypothetical protein